MVASDHNRPVQYNKHIKLTGNCLKMLAQTLLRGRLLLFKNYRIAIYTLIPYHQNGIAV